MTQDPVVLIMHQYAYYGKGSSIHSVRQSIHFCLDIDYQSSVIPGHKQHMVTPNQSIIPFNIVNGLTRMPMCPLMDDNLENLPHVVITSDDIWDPTILDNSIGPSNHTYHPPMDLHIDEDEFTSLDDCPSVTGNYLHHNDYGPDYISDGYHNKHVSCSGLDLITADNSYFYHSSP